MMTSMKLTNDIKYPVCFPNILTLLGKLVTSKSFPEHAILLGA